ncbi:hypothetical protein ACM26W_01455 [Halomonas sp. HK25]|uniref:hypothetical protein n=1 Tax=Halomonas sp. HK25 TaxID=3394321 RepID=UPI0039FD19AD
MSEPTERTPDHQPAGHASSSKHRGKPGAGKGSRKALYGLLAVSLAGALASGALLLKPAADEVPVETLVQSQMQQAVVPLQESLAQVESQQAALKQHLTELGQRLDRAEKRGQKNAAGITATQAQLEQLEQLDQLEPRLSELAEGLSRLDSVLNLRVTAQNEQIRTLSERLEQSQRQQPSPRPATAHQAPRPVAPPSPPFQVTGVESRGGRPYVGVSPNGMSSLRDIRLLGVGDRQDGWELSAIRGSHAVFRHSGRSVDVQIP